MSLLWVTAAHQIHEGVEPNYFPGTPDWPTLAIHHPDAVGAWSDIPDGVASQVSYRDMGDHIQVGYRATHQDFERKGLATLLQDELERRAAGRPIRSTENELSEDGWAFRDAYRRSHPSSTWEGPS